MRFFALVRGALFLAFAATITQSSIAVAADAAWQEEMLGVTVQLNGNCSGTLIYSDRDKKTGDVDTYILTAAHCVKGSESKNMTVDIPVYQENRVVKRESYVAKYKTKSFSADLAVVELIDKKTYFDKVATLPGEKISIEMGDRVYTVGYPMGLGLTITEGLFSSYDSINFPKRNEDTEYYRATPDIIGGNSGGALYHKRPDGKYELIGVTTAGIRGAPYMGFYTPAKKIRDFLKTAAPKAIDFKVEEVFQP